MPVVVAVSNLPVAKSMNLQLSVTVTRTHSDGVFNVFFSHSLNLTSNKLESLATDPCFYIYPGKLHDEKYPTIFSNENLEGQWDIRLPMWASNCSLEGEDVNVNSFSW